MQALSDSAAVPLDLAKREVFVRAARDMASDALRVLAIAYKNKATPEDAEREIVLLGLVGMIDPPRPEVKAAIGQCEQAGIKPLMIAGGLWSGMVSLLFFRWALDSGRTLEEAMSMVFVSLVLIEFLKAYNFRCDRQSLYYRPFANKWLNLAIAWEMILIILVVYLPFFQSAIGTFSLPLEDWLIGGSVALTICPVLETMKLLERRGWLGPL